MRPADVVGQGQDAQWPCNPVAMQSMRCRNSGSIDVSITAATPAGPISPENQSPPNPAWPLRPAGAGESDRNGFGDPVALQLSAEARVRTLSDPDHAANGRNDPVAAVEDRPRGFPAQVTGPEKGSG